jgi:hypothetical protein
VPSVAIESVAALERAFTIPSMIANRWFSLLILLACSTSCVAFVEHFGISLRLGAIASHSRRGVAAATVGARAGTGRLFVDAALRCRLRASASSSASPENPATTTDSTTDTTSASNSEIESIESTFRLWYEQLRDAFNSSQGLLPVELSSDYASAEGFIGGGGADKKPDKVIRFFSEAFTTASPKFDYIRVVGFSGAGYNVLNFVALPNAAYELPVFGVDIGNERRRNVAHLLLCFETSYC